MRIGLGLGVSRLGGGTAPVLDPFTKLLINFDGIDGSQIIIDEKEHIVENIDTGGGKGVEIDSAQTVFDKTTGLFNTVIGGQLRVDGTDFAIGTDDCVIDFRFRNKTSVEGRHLISLRGTNGANTFNPLIWLYEGFLIFTAASGDRLDSGDTILDNAWYHAAWVRSSGQSRLFVDGVQVDDTYTDTNDYTAPDYLWIGGEGGSSNRNDGWLYGLRMSIGTDRGWFNGFTPPSSPYSIYQ